MNFFEYIESIELDNISINEYSITHSETDELLVQKDKNYYKVHLKRYDDKQNKYVYRFAQLKEFHFPDDYDYSKLFFRKLQLSFYHISKEFLQIEPKSIRKIILSNEKNIFRSYKGTLTISTNKYDELLAVANQINKRANSYRKSIQTYLINQRRTDFKGKVKKKTTSITQGEFNFIVNRLNIERKNKIKDFTKYLNDVDIKSIQDLTEKLIKYEVFDSEFLRGLDEYFIKEKLQDIVKLGREILKIGRNDIKTDRAKKVISRIIGTDRKDIKQLENIWQKYFKKYLLYLIFSYRKIYSKVEFEVDLEKKYPDFLGINHYWGVDIIEIKHHLLPALMYDKSHNNYAFSGDLSKAIIQTINYSDALIREKFKTETDIQDEFKKSVLSKNVHRPRGIIIISSKERLIKTNKKLSEEQIKFIERDFTKLRNSLNNIEILTFDEILDTADYYSTNIIKKPST